MNQPASNIYMLYVERCEDFICTLLHHGREDEEEEEEAVHSQPTQFMEVCSMNY